MSGAALPSLPDPDRVLFASDMHLDDRHPALVERFLTELAARLQAEGRRPVVLATVSPMDSHGYFSLSVSAIYERDLIDQGALVLLEVNPNFPRTFGDTQVHISEVDALVESDRPIPTKSLVPYTEVDK